MRPDDRWLRIDLPFLMDRWALARELSSSLEADVIALRVQTGADTFEYQHFVDGQSARALSYSRDAERPWAQPLGDPEPWEDGTIFSDEALAAELEDRDDDEDAAKIRAVYTRRVIDPQSRSPFHGASRLADGLARHFGISPFADPGADPSGEPVVVVRFGGALDTVGVLLILAGLPLAAAYRLHPSPALLLLAIGAPFIGVATRAREMSPFLRFGLAVIVAILISLIGYAGS